VTWTIRAFSDYLDHADQLLASTSPLAALDGCVRQLGEVLGFDAAWYGFLGSDARPAARSPQSGAGPTPALVGAAAINLPTGFAQAWQSMRHEDLLVAQLRAAPNEVATYRRRQASQTEGMSTMADRYGVGAIATATATATAAGKPRATHQSTLFLSCMRAKGLRDHRWRVDEQHFLHAAVKTLDRLFRAHTESQPSEDTKAIELLVTASGRCVLGGARLGTWGLAMEGPLGAPLQAAIQQALVRAEPVMATALGIVITPSAFEPGAGSDLRGILLTPMEPKQMLSPREAEVATLLAQGLNHKAVARQLGIAPATVRNQTSRIYEKLGVNNRAALATSLAHLSRNQGWRP
jgi:DNA-binding NarL/FixJ family response regulator